VLLLSISTARLDTAFECDANATGIVGRDGFFGTLSRTRAQATRSNFLKAGQQWIGRLTRASLGRLRFTLAQAETDTLAKWT